MNIRGILDTQDVTEEYKAFLAHTAKRIKGLRRERGLTLRDMVVVHGYHDSTGDAWNVKGSEAAVITSHREGFRSAYHRAHRWRLALTA